MQTRSGKVYTNASASASSLKEKKTSVEIKVEKRPNSQRLAERTERLAALKPTPVATPTINERVATFPSNSFGGTKIYTNIRPNGLLRAPSGFVIPMLMSNELAEFLGLPAGTRLARTDVSRLINRYISVNKLQDPKNGRIINPDSKLRSLLNVGKNDEVTYFNLQKYMKPHFYRE
jgi:chromatin remodeling complex protein RSC6